STQDTSPLPPALSTADAPHIPSKSQRKRDAHALQALGVQLVALSATQLARLELPEAPARGRDSGAAHALARGAHAPDAVYWQGHAADRACRAQPYPHGIGARTG